MGQIVGGAAKPKRCNLNKLSQLETPAAGEYILVSSDNSMNAAGQGNFDCYIVGNGRDAATALPLIKTYANDVDNEPTADSEKLVKSGGALKSINKAQIQYFCSGNSYVNGNTIHIDKLVRYGNNTGGANSDKSEVINVNGSFTVSNLFFLVYDRVDKSVKSITQANLTSEQDLLLVSKGDGFYPTGKLYNWVNSAQELSIEQALQISEADKGINNTGQVVTASGYVICSPIDFCKGTKLSLTTYGSGYSALSMLNEDGTYTPIIAKPTGLTPTAPKYDTITIDEDGKYVISSFWRSNYIPNIKIEKFVRGSRSDVKEFDMEIPMTAGTFLASNGAYSNLASEGIFKFFISEKLIHSTKECIIDEIGGIKDGEDYYILQFDSNMSFLSYAKNNKSLSNSCRYIRICVGKSDNSAYNYSEREGLRVKVSTSGKCSIEYNKIAQDKIENFIFHTYEVKNTLVDNAVNTTDYYGTDVRIYNKCYVVLPKNYDENGKPVPVIIHCAGTSGIRMSDTDGLQYNDKYIRFLSKCGYAVIGCYSQSSLYIHNDDTDVPSALTMSCYQSMWKYLTSLYNIDKSGAYIFGFSSGGKVAVFLSQIKTIPIKCAASLSGGLDIVANMRVLTAAGCNEGIFDRFGISHGTLPPALSDSGYMGIVNSDIQQSILDNIDTIKSYNAFSYHSNLDYRAFLEEFMSIPANTSSIASNQTLQNLTKDAFVILDAPLKLWHAVDDANVAIQMVRWYVRMVRNGGGTCFLREFPAGCGRHYAVGYTGDESNTPMVDYDTPFGETINIPVAYAEMVDWFKRW